MKTDPGFGHPFTAAIAAELVVFLAMFVGAVIIVNFYGILVMP